MTTRQRPFGACLVYARKRRDMSASELARRTGLNQAAISHFECDRREPSADSLRKLAVALDVTADFLLGLSTETRRIGD